MTDELKSLIRKHRLIAMADELQRVCYILEDVGIDNGRSIEEVRASCEYQAVANRYASVVRVAKGLVKNHEEEYNEGNV